MTAEERRVLRLLTGWIVGEYGASLIGLSVLVKSEGGAWKRSNTKNTLNNCSDFHSVHRQNDGAKTKQSKHRLVSPVEQ